ncbi:protein NKG7-like [Rhineura floridana]|uniref:protein NKG7-like n=1 Tax=Rhineura floridana TaxID=261503 RepID=UPI002AC836DF|nr:protein NKG7-like [Rhineura floridana]XP_061452551.1 protein NKG7-like [Rhineura floridana]XP_061452552.1 protein NKG7-like [Rhineura floridana]XP_061452553.1 protein NKG7-like [Rhineura floridana]
MVPCRIFSILVASISIVLLLIALTTNYWLVAYGPSSIVHSGLWQVCIDGHCFAPDMANEYIIATRAFLILASLVALALVLFLIPSIMPWDCGTISGPFVTSIAAFIAGIFTLVAVAVFTAESWGRNKDPQIQLTFEWSFYLAWSAFPMLLLTGIFSLVAHLCSSRSAYDSL